MDALFFHPKVVHLPMALAVLVPLFATGIAVAWWRGWLPRRAWWIAVAMQALLLGSSIASLRTGEIEEDRVEDIVGHDAVHAHEEAAEQFTVAVGITAGVMVVAAFVGGKLAPIAVGLGLLGTLLGLGLGVRTGEAGGALVYQHGAARAYTEGGAAPPAKAEDDGHPEKDGD